MMIYVGSKWVLSHIYKLTEDNLSLSVELSGIIAYGVGGTMHSIVCLDLPKEFRIDHVWLCFPRAKSSCGGLMNAVEFQLQEDIL
jgi:hypothetical protein